MNLREWARATHRALSKQREEGGAALSGDLVELVLRAGISTLVDTLVDDGELRIDALGRLWIEEKAARRVVSNLSGKRRAYAVERRRMVRFRASRGLVAAVNYRRIGEEPEFMRERTLETSKKSRGREEDG